MLDCGNRQVDCCSFCHISKKYRYEDIHISKQEERELLSCSPSNVFRSSFVVSLVGCRQPLFRSHLLTAPYSFQCPQTRCWWNLYFLEKHVYKIWICWWMYASDMAWRTIPLLVDLHKLGLDIDELGGHRSLGVLWLEVLFVGLEKIMARSKQVFR